MSEFSETSEIINELVMESAHADGAHLSSPGWHKQVAMSIIVEQKSLWLIGLVFAGAGGIGVMYGIFILVF